MRKLSIVIPAYNEEKTIQTLLKRVELARLPDNLEKEIIIVDDNSSDRTIERVKALGKNYKIFSHTKNKGKGGALKTGFRHVTGDFVIIQDADLEYDPAEYPRLVNLLLRDDADVVYGSRFVGSDPHRVLLYYHYLGNKFLTFLSNILTGLNLTDMETCYKAFKREVIDEIKDKITARRFGIEPEITALVAKGNWRVYEVGISYYGRTYEEGKKINWKDGLAAIWHVIKYNIFR
jgi:glycosyltransferase involved in cell wall biosynthesis